MNKYGMLTPPGKSFEIMKKVFLTLLIISLLASLIPYIANLRQAIDSLYLYSSQGNHRILDPEAVPWAFSEVLGKALWGFYFSSLAMLVFVIDNYLYFYTSRSNYVMKRVKNPMELHLRCWRSPLTLAITLAAAGIVMRAIYFALYRVALPAGVEIPRWSQLF